ncbi:NADPH-dependent FMN reductase [Streptomyces zagrosensis]|uniref:NAD(P)H-dependent FMN reductase n=1 Tax=Streptomyces zagrosensis TaxID=1042984 RepID=A0A7W9QAS3_9ACTN|nr:NAD(P)H-dependent oxidoreductase [Streptomyces zagrosensis]MBB5936549.1 NAD(P)H-dependent FMN reductase [Streptomyces zagrosensis]
MLKIAIIIGSTRPSRRTAVAAEWVAQVSARHTAATRGEVAFEIVDLADYALPALDEPLPALFGDYRHPHTVQWAHTIASFDGFVFVTPEYNHSFPGALKNAIDFLYAEWNNKAAGFVSHGVHGGIRAVEHLRLTMTELQVANVRTQVALSAFTDFAITDPSEPGVITPGPHQESTLYELLDEVIAWSGVLKPLRTATAQTAPA